MPGTYSFATNTRAATQANTGAAVALNYQGSAGYRWDSASSLVHSRHRHLGLKFIIGSPFLLWSFLSRILHVGCRRQALVSGLSGLSGLRKKIHYRLSELQTLNSDLGVWRPGSVQVYLFFFFNSGAGVS